MPSLISVTDQTWFPPLYPFLIHYRIGKGPSPDTLLEADTLLLHTLTSSLCGYELLHPFPVYYYQQACRGAFYPFVLVSDDGDAEQPQCCSLSDVTHNSLPLDSKVLTTALLPSPLPCLPGRGAATIPLLFLSLSLVCFFGFFFADGSDKRWARANRRVSVDTSKQKTNKKVFSAEIIWNAVQPKQSPLHPRCTIIFSRIQLLLACLENRRQYATNLYLDIGVFVM